MMPSSGPKKRENTSRMDKNNKDFPQLSNEMQLSIMNSVKNGELSIEDALTRARKKISAEEEQQPSQYNFSVHKHSHYRWQKRVLQIDFKTKMLCSIEKGIIKRQLPFSIVKSCDDGVGSRFSISFKGHHDYELEATSLEDKHKMIRLVNQIIYGNIYSDPEEGDAETLQQPQAPQSLREGVLALHRGGLASFRWVKYEVKLHPGQLTLVPLRRRSPDDGEATSSAPVSTVIHLSDGDTSVQKPQSPDTFTLITHKNEYHFRVPAAEQTTAPGAVQSERDAWVKAIDRLCKDWKRKSMAENVFVEREVPRNISITEDAEDADADLGPIYPTIDYKVVETTSGGGDRLLAGDTAQSSPNKKKPVPTPRRPSKTAAEDSSPPVPLPTSPGVVPLPLPTSPKPSPAPTVLTSSSTVPKPPSVVKVPTPPAPPPPPLVPFKMRTNSTKPRTKAFHWDLVSSEKIAKSFWKQERNTRRIEIDTSCLYEQFAVKDLGTFNAAEPSNTQHIMLNQKIAHNFNIFLKSFPVQPGELKDKLFIVNEEDGGLSDEHITSLRRYVPTMDDIEMYNSHKGPVTELHIVDQYMMETECPLAFWEMVPEHERDGLTMWSDLLEMCNIPYLSTQLDLLLTLRQLPISMNDLQPLINQKIRMCTQLSNCRSFVSVLEYILAIGNYLNENARKEKAKGFRLSSLTKLSLLRGRDRKFTLLHALVEQIMLHEPRLATFTEELAEFETVPGASIKGLTAEVDVLKNEVQKVIQYKKTSKKRNPEVEQPKFSKDLKMAIEKYNTNLSALTKTCEEMKKLYSVILVKFGEPADQDSQEFFGLICQFVHDFRSAHAETI